MAAEDGAGAGASIIPVTDAQAKLGKTAIEEGGKLGRYVGRILGDVPSDMVQVFIGQHLRFARILIADSYDRRIREILERRNAKTEPLSPSVAIPLITAAYEESRPELQAFWAALIAAAMDPARSDRMRLAFIGTLKQFDPLDALLLRQLPTLPGNQEPFAAQFWATRLGVGLNAVLVSVDNLNRLGCITILPANNKQLPLTPYGQELLRTCED
jgi:hypothetical protein